MWCWNNIAKDEEEQVEMLFRVIHPELFARVEEGRDIMAEAAERASIDVSEEEPDAALAEKIRKFNKLDEVE